MYVLTPNYRLNVRVVTETPWANLFCYNMFLRPEQEELESFTAEWILLCVPSFMADPAVDGYRQSNFAILDFTRKVVLIGGTGYTGEMKKGIFSALNFILPVDKNALPMHCSSNVGDKTIQLFSLACQELEKQLYQQIQRKLIGDDEHGWTSENTVFNFEGGCYAKVVNLSEENEPDIFRAIKKAILENVGF
jgi:phosphoenolpyruvate carboxykinase (ATP)